MNRTTWPPPGATDRFPTQPIPLDRGRGRFVHGDHGRAPGAADRRHPPPHRPPPPPHHPAPARGASRRDPARPARSTVLVAAAVVVAAVAAVLGLLSWPAPSPTAAPEVPAVSAPATAAPPVDGLPQRPPPQRTDGPDRDGPDRDGPDRDGRGALGEADGAVSDGVTVFDDDVPAVANLDPALLDALREATTAAADDGVELVVNSGWRSREYQEQLLEEAISTYGSEAEAARWVSTPDTSLHVSGDAVDIGPTRATDWLSRHGAEHGLCRIYRNEPWHYELRPDAVDDGCPPLYADPTHDPRMQK